MNPYQLTKRRCTSGGWALLVYYGIFNLVVMAAMLVPIFVESFAFGLRGQMPTDSEMNSMINDTMQNAWGYIVACLIGLGAAFLWKKKDFMTKTVFHRGKPMSFGNFLCLVCVANSSQLIFSLLSIGLEWLMNQLGLSIQQSQEAATMTATSFSMFLYAGVFAPVFEEIFFRGVLLRHIQPYGKRLAVFASAFLFGMFHGNIVQSPFAFCIGLVYGYTAVTYNILWSMVLHMFNNLVLSDMLTRLIPLVGEAPVNIAYSVIILGSTLATIFILIFRRKSIGAYLRENKMAKGSLRAFFLAPSVIIFNILMILGILATLLLPVLMQMLEGMA